MDTIFKVCDAMENVTLAAATVAPKVFSCGADTSVSDPSEKRGYGSACGNIPARFASHDLAYFVDDNSVLTYDRDNTVLESSPVRTKERYHHPWRKKQLNEQILPSEEGTTYTTPPRNSRASGDGRKPRRPLAAYSRSREELPSAMGGFHEETSDNDQTHQTHQTYWTHDGTHGTGDDNYFDERSSRSHGTKRETDKSEKVGLDKIGGYLGLPLHWTHAVRKKSSWSSNSKKTSSTSTTSTSSSYDDSSAGRSRSRRDEQNSVDLQDPLYDDSQEEDDHRKNPKSGGFGATILLNASSAGDHQQPMIRELPSFGKSREFRSFGSKGSLDRSLESMGSSYSLKPTFMTVRESNQLHEKSIGYKYIIPTGSSDRSSTASSSTNTNTNTNPENRAAIVSALSPEANGTEVDLGHTTATIAYASLVK